MEHIIALQESAKVVEVAIVDLLANLLNHLLSRCEVALSSDHWLLLAFSDLWCIFENSNMRVVEGFDKVCGSNFPVNVRVKCLHDRDEFVLWIELDLSELADLHEIDQF